MRADRLKGPRAAAALTATALLGLLLTFGPAQQAQAATYVPIVGAGSTYAYPALNQWAIDLQSQGLSLSYTPNGSAQGRQNFASTTVDYAGTDIAYIPRSQPDPFGSFDSMAYAYSYVPDVAGGLSFLYNVQVAGRKITNMRLSGATLAGIFTGHITNWDDSAITRDYGQRLPSIPITVVTRSDGAGESYFLTQWMQDEYSNLWTPYCQLRGGGSLCGKDPTEFFPIPSGDPQFKALDGADEVAGYVNSSVNNGAIGYAEEAYAIPDNIPVVAMRNAAGYDVKPTAANVAVSLHAATINENVNSVDFLMQTLTPVYSNRDPRTYPLSSYSYLAVPRDSRAGYQSDSSFFSAADGKTLSTYLNYILCGAQQSAAALGYSPLPAPMVTGGFTQVGHIPGAVTSPAASHYSSCNNPAFLNGRDIILDTAPQPNPCQQATAPLNCVVQGGRAVASNNGPSNAGGNGHVGPSSGPSSGAGGPNAAINPNTGQVGNGTGPVTSNVLAKPVGFAGQPVQQWTLGTLTAVELLAVIVVPTLLGTALQRSGRRRATQGPGGPAGPLPAGTSGTPDTGQG
jgi:ABC-type phosphate transport system substrate-binding protein